MTKQKRVSAPESVPQHRIHISVQEESKNGEKSKKVIIIENYKGWIIVTVAIIMAIAILGFFYLKAS